LNNIPSYRWSNGERIASAGVWPHSHMLLPTHDFPGIWGVGRARIWRRVSGSLLRHCASQGRAITIFIQRRRWELWLVGLWAWHGRRLRGGDRCARRAWPSVTPTPHIEAPCSRFPAAAAQRLGPRRLNTRGQRPRVRTRLSPRSTDKKRPAQPTKTLARSTGSHLAAAARARSTPSRCAWVRGGTPALPLPRAPGRPWSLPPPVRKRGVSVS
jgi:hypothetical protein